jgi:excisionase family DNA binding protein
MINATMEPKAMTHWLILQEAAQYLKIGKSTLYDLARKGTVPAHKMGREWRFDAEELDEWIRHGDSATAGKQTDKKAVEQ